MTYPKLLTVQLLKERLAEKGVKFAEATIDSRSYTIFSKPGGRTWFTSNAHVLYPFINAHSRQISCHKELTYALAKSNGIQIPETFVFTRDSSVIDAQTFLRTHKLLIVKPGKASISRGLTRHVQSMPQLEAAIAFAREHSKKVLLQRQVTGDEIRFTVVKGKVVSAIARLSPRVIGNGQLTVGELIARENQERTALDLPYIAYPELTDEFIDDPALDTHYIPAAGEIIELSRASMIRDGASFYEVKEDIHPSYIALAEKMAMALKMNFVAVDIMIDDYTEPANATNYAFIECNESPVLRVYYSSRNKKNYDILQDLVPLIDDWLSCRTQSRQELLGAFESVSFPELGLQDVTAKVDTGAYSGALFCPYIKVIRKEGKKVLAFRIFGDDGVLHETTRYSATYVRSASGHRSRRYLVDTSIIVKGEKYPIRIGLSDRSDLKYPVLLGRRFLREHSMIVDVRINQTHDNREEEAL